MWLHHLLHTIYNRVIPRYFVRCGIYIQSFLVWDILKFMQHSKVIPLLHGR